MEQEIDKTNGMSLVYKKYKDFKVVENSYSGIVCGINSDKILCATEDNPQCSFRRTDKDTWIKEEFRDRKYRYFYFDENQLDRQTKSGRKRK